MTPAASFARWAAQLPMASATPPTSARLALGIDAIPVDLAAGAVLKLKVGRRPLADEMRAIADLAVRGVRLRLDGNRGLAVSDAVTLAEAAGTALAFFEEPVATDQQQALPAWLPLALDETLLDAPSDVRDVVVNLPGVRALVIKPTVLGARRAFGFVDLAKSLSLDVVVSSAYESAVGAMALAHFAHAVAPHSVHGLDARLPVEPFAVPATLDDVMALGALPARGAQVPA